MKLTTIACTFVLGGCIFMSCNHAEKNAKAETADATINHLVTLEPEGTSDEKQQLPIPVPGEPQQPAVTDSTAQPSPVPQPVTPNIDWDKKIIKTATVKYEVKSFDQFNKDLRDKVRKYGGYIAQEDNYQYEDRKEIALIIKVPVVQFETMMNDMQGKDCKQIERTIKTEDVTGEVVDTKSRLEAKKEMRLKYLEFLKQSKNMKEVLEVQSEINAIQEEIESAQGRVQYLSKQAAYSTINLSFYQPMEGFKAPSDDNSFFNKTGEAFGRGAELIKALLLVIISNWPFILAVLLGIFIWKRKRQSQPVASK